MSNTWFSSDLHFGHVNILGFCRSEFFADLDEMREMIIYNWNNVVAPEDEVYILGDAVMGHRAEQLPHIDRLNGHKYLIAGNHDYWHPCNPAKIVNKWAETYEEHFAWIGIDAEIQLGEHEALLCHFPAEGDHTEEERYIEYRPILEDSQILIHGHLHCEDIFTGPRQIHIGIDSDWTAFNVERFHPIPESAIIEAIELMKDTNWDV